MDIFNPFVIDMSIETPSRTVATGDGNGTLVDLSGFPLFALSGADKIQASFYNYKNLIYLSNIIISTCSAIIIVNPIIVILAIH